MKSKVRLLGKPEKAIRQLEKMNARFKGPDSVRVGLPRGSNDYPDGTSVLMVGAVHEFGSPKLKIPQRSYLRSTLQEGKRKYKGIITKLSEKIVNGDEGMDKELALNLMGLQLQTDVREKITDIKDPPLKNREGNPLIDTGHLRQSIVFKVGDD